MKSRDELIAYGRQALGPAASAALELAPMDVRGSDRRFFRLRWNGETAILMDYDPKRLENSYYADIAKFLDQIGVPVPHLIAHDPLQCLVVMEDLGDKDLWSLRLEPWETRRTLYQRVLEGMQELHAFPEARFPFDEVRLMEAFGPELYAWERNYFRNQFVTNLCRLEPDPTFEQELELELDGLSNRLVSGPRSLVHRDLQSQNLVIRNSRPFFIDFQGMRFGNPFYDLGSLLCDPYVSFSEAEREELLSFHYRLSNWNLEWENYRKAFWECSAQRLMQALGAYGFLGLTKGLQSFLGHVPAGLANLRQSAAKAGSLPRLCQLTLECAEALNRRSIQESESGTPPRSVAPA